jgi:hypothetical protein
LKQSKGFVKEVLVHRLDEISIELGAKEAAFASGDIKQVSVGHPSCPSTYTGHQTRNAHTLYPVGAVAHRYAETSEINQERQVQISRGGIALHCTGPEADRQIEAPGEDNRRSELEQLIAQATREPHIYHTDAISLLANT